MKKKMLFGILAVSLITGGTCSAFAQENTATAQNFIVEKENADTYINPLPLDYARSSSEGKGEIADNPFMVGQMIGNEAIPNDPVEQITHARFQDMFRGTSTYISENDT